MEELKTIEPISLDFYNNNIKTINAKQLDTNSRYVKISCTEHGKRVVLNPQTMNAYLTSKKPDGFYVIHKCEILDDGTLLVDFLQQMLAVAGKSKVDILIVSGAISDDVLVDGMIITDDGKGNVTTNFNLDDFVQSIYNSGATVLSTMSFYLNVLPSNIKEANIESSYEFSALVNGLEQMNTVEIHMKALDELLTENEEIRLSNETERQNAEVARVNAENLREENVQAVIDRCNVAVSDANTATSNANNATTKANQATQNANTATQNANTATSNANNAAKNANDAAALCESVVDGSGVVLKTDVANNLTTETEGKVLDALQGKLLLEKIDTLQQVINNLPKIHHGTGEPNNSLGKDGDIYLQIIDDTTTSIETVGE